MILFEGSRSLIPFTCWRRWAGFFVLPTPENRRPANNQQVKVSVTFSDLSFFVLTYRINGVYPGKLSSGRRLCLCLEGEGLSILFCRGNIDKFHGLIKVFLDHLLDFIQ